MGWQDEFRDALIRALVDDGMPVDDKPDRFSWLAKNWRALYAHLAECDLDTAACEYDDETWTEFAGTFAEPGDEWNAGIRVTVRCRCRQIDGRAWRWKGEYAELIRRITDAPKPPAKTKGRAR